MLEKQLEKYFLWAVASLGGKTYKFRSIKQSGVADRIVCLPNGDTWFVELKAPNGKLSELQKFFANEVTGLSQKYACLWEKEQIDEWLETQRLPRISR
jgi:hypothetical protein